MLQSALHAKLLSKKGVIFIVGPTAVGKTDAAIYCAQELDGEIISSDSMQIYRGLDIVSSKPSPQQQALVAHHLIDILEPTKDFNVAQFCSLSKKALEDILNRGKVPIFAGGTGLYLLGLVDGIFEQDSNDPSVRDALSAELKEKGSEALHDELLRIDPDAALLIHKNDGRRIVRALEVFKVTGIPITQLKQRRTGLSKQYPIRMYCLSASAEVLKQRIQERVQEMVEHGLIDEVKTLLKQGLSKTAYYAIGIREVEKYLNNQCTQDELPELISKNTYAYVRRQMTWFRKEKRLIWIDTSDAHSFEEVGQRIVTDLNKWQ